MSHQVQYPSSSSHYNLGFPNAGFDYQRELSQLWRMYCTSVFFSDSWCTGLPGTYVGFPPWNTHNSRNSELIEVRITTITTCAWSFDDCYCIYCLVGGLEHEFYDFPFSWECHHPNWRSHIFQRGRYTTNQVHISTINHTCWSCTYWAIVWGIHFVVYLPPGSSQRIHPYS